MEAIRSQPQESIPLERRTSGIRRVWLRVHRNHPVVITWCILVILVTALAVCMWADSPEARIDRARALVRLGEARERQRDVFGALRFYEKAIETRGEHVATLAALVRLCVGQGFKRAAQRYRRRLLRLSGLAESQAAGVRRGDRSSRKGEQ